MSRGGDVQLRLFLDDRPFSCYLRRRVERALASGLQGDERPLVERWLEGSRRLDSMIRPAR